jgi:hypothetical protein
MANDIPIRFPKVVSYRLQGTLFINRESGIQKPMSIWLSSKKTRDPTIQTQEWKYLKTMPPGKMWHKQYASKNTGRSGAMRFFIELLTGDLL